MNQESAKAVAAAMAAVWQGEFPATVRVLSAVSDAGRDYSPHPKSRTAWQVTTHIATADIWFIDSIINGAFIWDTEKAQEAEAQFGKVADVVAFYEKTFPAKLAGVLQLPGETLAEDLDFFGMMTMPRAQWIGFANNHSVHHRGQLSAYLRAMGCKVPDIYGPSGDAEPAS
ncbi:MAG TPA: DinB family protein [Longimicrobiales bacterium]|nr:DinB family protein [Longimicrobiales bacterium]